MSTHAPHPKAAHFVTARVLGQGSDVAVKRRRAVCGALLCALGCMPQHVECPRCLAALARMPGYANKLRAEGWTFRGECRP